MSACTQYTDAEIDTLRQSGAMLGNCLRHTAGFVKAGITLKELDTIAEQFITARGALPAFKGYHGYPATLCISVNDAAVHGIPDDTILQEGDIVTLDGGVQLDGLITDAAITVPVGPISNLAQKLITSAEKALDRAIATVRAGVHTGDISQEIEQQARHDGFSPIPSLTGHGVGKAIHLYPDIPNRGKAGNGAELPAGTVVAIEPIFSVGDTDVRLDKDQWTFRTIDGSLSTHAEHTILVTEEGCEVLTMPQE